MRREYPTGPGPTHRSPSICCMGVRREPLGRANLHEVFEFVRSANPFVQYTCGWDAGRFVDWRWGSSPAFEAAEPNWMARHCTIYRDGAEIAAVSIAEYGDAADLHSP